jgi:hypothetical protein
MKTQMTATATFHMTRPDADYLEGKCPLSLCVQSLRFDGAGEGTVFLEGKALDLALLLVAELEKQMPRCRISGLDLKLKTV